MIVFTPEKIVSDIKPYWKQGNEGSFHWLYKKVVEIEKTTNAERLRAISEISKSLNANLLVAKRRLLKGQVLALRDIEKRMEPIQQIVDAGYEFEFHSTDQGDFASFAERAEKLKGDIARVYKDALYPFLLALQNGEKKWNPSGFICQICDLYNWYKVLDPKAELEKHFPKKLD